MASPTNELEPTWGRVLSVWWLLTWRWGLVGFLFSFILGFVWGFLGRVIAVSPDALFYGGGIIGVVTTIIWGMIAIRMALRKSYSRQGFRLALISSPSN